MTFLAVDKGFLETKCIFPVNLGVNTRPAATRGAIEHTQCKHPYSFMHQTSTPTCYTNATDGAKTVIYIKI